MANLAAQLRANAQSIWPGASVAARGRDYLLHQHPTDPTRRMVDISLGAIHYGAQFDQEIDTAWIPTSAPEDSPYIRKMDLADYKALFGNGNLLFTPAFPFRYINPTTGDFLSWQANPNLQWTNDQNSVANIGLAKQAIEAQITDDALFFPGVYGTGFDFTIELQTTRLMKKLTVANAATIGTPPQNIIDGGNPVMMLSFQFQRSAGVTIWVDGVQWGEGTGQGNAIATVNTVEFKDSLGNILWAMPPAWAVGANENSPPNVVTRFRRAGSSFFIEYRLAWPWLQTAAYPITLDPTVDTQVAAGADDAHELDDGTGFAGTNASIRASSNTSAASRFNAGTRFTLTGPANGDTINVAYLPIHALNGGSDDPNSEIYCEDVDNAANYTTTADVTSRVRTIAFTNWTATGIGTGEVNSPSVVSAVQAVIDRAGWASGNAINFIWHGKSDVNQAFTMDAFEGTSTECAKLHIEYTAAGGAAGQPFPVRMQGIPTGRRDRPSRWN
jgi:hypothetical protein